MVMSKLLLTILGMGLLTFLMEDGENDEKSNVRHNGRGVDGRGGSKDSSNDGVKPDAEKEKIKKLALKTKKRIEDARAEGVALGKLEAEKEAKKEAKKEAINKEDDKK